MRVNNKSSLYESFINNLNEDKNQDFLNYLDLDNAAMRYAGIDPGKDMTFDQYNKYQEFIRNAKKKDKSRFEITISYWDRNGYEKEKTYVGKSVKEIAKKFVDAKDKYDFNELEDWSDNLGELCGTNYRTSAVEEYLDRVASGKEEVKESEKLENKENLKEDNSYQVIYDFNIGNNEYAMVKDYGEDGFGDDYYQIEFYTNDEKYYDTYVPKSWTENQCRRFAVLVSTEDNLGANEDNLRAIVNNMSKKDIKEGYAFTNKNKLKLKESNIVWSSEYTEDDGSVNDYDEGVWEVQKEDLEYNIVPKIKEQTTDDIVFFCGTVGRWNGNFNGGKVVEVNNADDLLFGDVDTINLLNDNGNLVWEGIHHDGSHMMGLYAMPKDEETRKKLVEELGIVDWYYGMYQYDSREEALQDALNDLYSASRLNDILEPKDFADIAKICQPIKVKE